MKFFKLFTATKFDRLFWYTVLVVLLTCWVNQQFFREAEPLTMRSQATTSTSDDGFRHWPDDMNIEPDGMSD
jgi:hypothetical protein